MTTQLKYYVVVAQWLGNSCYECPGDNGRDWTVVRAEDAEAALDLVMVDKQLEPGDDEITYLAFELARKPGPQARLSKWMDGVPLCDGFGIQKPPPSSLCRSDEA